MMDHEDWTEGLQVTQQQSLETGGYRTTLEDINVERMIQIEAPTIPRRSTRAGKGSTTRYQDFDMQHLDATVTDMPIILIDTKEEDVGNSDGAAAAITMWLPWATIG